MFKQRLPLMNIIDEYMLRGQMMNIINELSIDAIKHISFHDEIINIIIKVGIDVVTNIFHH